VNALTLLAELFAVAAVWFAVGRFGRPPWKTGAIFTLKLYLTLRVFSLILLHEVDGQTIYESLGAMIDELDLTTFVLFSLIAMVVRMVGVGASITRWALMLRGQGIELPPVHVLGAFLIGRFLGTFLPSTVGLDGYKLYDAARFSGRTIEVSTATAVEKILGVSGIFGTFLIALPLGVSIFGSYAPLIAAVGVPLALTPLAVVGLAFLWPGPVLIRWVMDRFPLPTLRPALQRISDGASAYAHHRGILLSCWVLSLLTHFSTAATYYFTARALGVRPEQAGFWEVTFASAIQIFATVISPFTIAGEGIRELAQGLLLQNQMTFAVAAASGLLGFLVAEAPTLVGVVPWFTRGERYRPGYCRVHGEQVDYEQARRSATDLGRSPEPDVAPGTIDTLRGRLVIAASFGAGAGLYAGALIGFAEASYLLVLGKVVEEAQVFWAAPLAYGLLFGAAGALGGTVLGVLPFPRRVLQRMVPPIGLVACLIPYALIATLFFLYRDFYAERLPPAPVLAGTIAAYAALALVALGVTWLLARTRVGRLFHAPAAAVLVGLSLLAAAGLGAVIGPQPPAPSAPRAIPAGLESRPNVLLVIVDTLRADALPAYGARELATPTLDRLAAEGTVFEAAFAQASWTKPSVASILTSLYPSSHTAVHKPSQLPDSVTTVAESFSAFGYTTSGIVTNVNLAPSFNFQQGFDDYAYLAPDYLFGARDSSSRLLLYEIGRRVAGKLAGAVRPGQAYQPADRVNARAVDWLAGHQDERFFLYLHYMEPHDPYFTHPDDGGAIARSSTPHPPAELRDEMRRRYDGEIEFFDRELGRLVADLEQRGLWDELLVLVTSDHGEEFQDHGGWWHGLTLYDEQIAIPLIVKWPKSRRGAPARWRQQVRALDVSPTLLGFAGAPVPPAMQGEDLLRGNRSERVVFAEEDHEGNVLEAVRARGWKLIRANEDNRRGLRPLELYAVSQDPAEQNDRAEAEPRRAAALSRDMDGLGRLARAEARGAQTAEIGRAECERLKALGYVDDCGS
jgi:arylsulfatase A-like enzyme/uncharacterized membrane protein YbhN (UPF0104 family)